jgi:hypothetical protein
MTDYPNPYDPEHSLERRDMSHAGILRRAAFKFEQKGQPVAATLFRNAAFMLENPHMRFDIAEPEERR